jgi:murein L,D-transpeptidase YcbB/YkuD
MTRQAFAMRHRPNLRGASRAALLGVAISALSAAGALAQASENASRDIAVPSVDYAPPPVGEGDFDRSPQATGSVDPAAPQLEAAAPAPAPVEAVDASRAFDPVAAAVTALLADESPATRVKMPARDRAALSAFYGARSGAPIWLSQGRPTSKADAARKRIEAAADDGLDPRRYALPASLAGADPADAARAELTLSAAALAYAREAWGGRVTPSVVSRSITAAPDAFDEAAALAALEGSADVAATLDGFNPTHPEFLALRRLLVEKRGERTADHDRPVIGNGPLLRPGGDDPRVPALRTRLGLSGDPDDFYYDDALAAAVTEFQKANKIGASGLINRQTISALNGPGRPDPTSLIELNMERWRWMPRDLGAKHVFVDVPAFGLKIVKDGAVVHETRVIVGKTTNQTPVFSNAIDHVVVNPYWNVPASIAVKEMLPQLRRNPGALNGYEVVVSDGKKTRVVSPGSVDWSGDLSRVRIRQPPGERNALGNIKFMFPNQHAVYLHDTPNRKLFAGSHRALSHGCVRVDKPLEFADALTGDQGWSGEQLKKLIGGRERRINLPSPIPVHLTYFTARVDDAGSLETRTDLYGLDARLRAAMNGERLPPLPAEPAEPAPKIVKAKPRQVAPQPAAQAAASIRQAETPTRPAGPGTWLSRIFGPRSN